MAYRRNATAFELVARPVQDLPAWNGPLVADLALATRAKPFSAPDWLFELKYDGWQVLAVKDGRAVTLRLRSGKDATVRFPEVAKAVAELPASRVLLDGELLVFGWDGRSSLLGFSVEMGLSQVDGRGVHRRRPRRCRV